MPRAIYRIGRRQVRLDQDPDGKVFASDEELLNEQIANALTGRIDQLTLTLRLLNREAAEIPGFDLERRLREISAGVQAKSSRYRVQALEDPGALLQIAFSPEPELRRSVANNPQASIEALELLARDRDEMVRNAVGHQLTDQRHLFELLANDPHPTPRLAIAINKRTPNDLRIRLTHDPDPEVRALALRYASRRDRALFERLARDPDPKVRAHCAGQDGLPEDLMRELASDPDQKVREQVAERRQLPDDLLRSLAQDPDPWVAREALCTRGNVRERARELGLFDEVRWDIAVELARSSDGWLLAKLVQHADARVRAEVAHNVVTPKPALEMLVRDPDPQVRERLLARNGMWTLGDRLLRLMADDPEPALRKRVRNRLRSHGVTLD